MPLLLGSFALGLVLFIALPAGAMSGALAIIVALLIAAGAFAMTFGAARGGPMKHALAGLLHLAFHPRQERFAAEGDVRREAVVPPTALKAPVLEQNEYGVGDFERTFTLSDDVSREGIEASVKDGVLQLRLPKTAKSARQKIHVVAR